MHQVHSVGLGEEDVLLNSWIRKPKISGSSRQPEFIHKITIQTLWMDSRQCPLWVKEEPTKSGCTAEPYNSMPVVTNDYDVISPSEIWACCKNKDLSRGTKLHHEIRRRGLIEGKYSDALITMYAKCLELKTAHALLDMYSSSSCIPWNSLIVGYLRQGQSQEALACFDQMQRSHIAPSSLTYGCILKACAATGALDKGKQIHDEILRQGLLEHDQVLGNILLHMYAKCGAFSQARDVLGKLPSRNISTWNSLINGYAQHGQGQQALDSFDQMQADGIDPDPLTYVSILKACASIRAVDRGKEIHDNILKHGHLEDDVVLGNALVDMYAKCGAMSKSHDVLAKLPSRNAITWNALISGYAQNGQGRQALECFQQMQADGVVPNAVTYVCTLKACASMGLIIMGKQVHDEIVKQGLLENNLVLGGALIDMYAKCGDLLKARDVLDNLPSRNVICWSALITGYIDNGQGQQALHCFEQMQAEGITPDAVTYASILSACASIGAVNWGKQIHDEILRKGLLKHNLVLGNALVDMYAKCGALSKAKVVLATLPSRDVISWSSLISGYSQEGQAEEAFKCYKRMQDEGIKPDAVTFLSLLNVCTHLGLLGKGQELFDSMETTYGLKPTIECFNCMIDLYGRVGHLRKAVDMIREMPFAVNISTWHAVLGACCKWVNISVGRWAFEQVLDVDRTDVTSYVLMKNVYTAAGMHQKANDVEAMRIKNKAWKLPACRWWSDKNDRPYKFGIVDANEDVMLRLQEISVKMSKEGYRPILDWTSQDMFEASKTQLLCLHPEQLALASALINTPAGDNIYIRKNMQMCDKCHTAISFISRTENRKIFVTDSTLRHCFENDKCSCNDCF